MKLKLSVTQPDAVPVKVVLNATLGELREIRSDLATATKGGALKLKQALDEVETLISESYLAYTPGEATELKEVEVP